MVVLMLLFVSLVIIGLTALSIWGLIPQNETNNYFFRATVWLSRPTRGSERTRALFIAIPVVYAAFFSWMAGVPLVIATVLLFVFNSRYLIHLSK